MSKKQDHNQEHNSNEQNKQQRNTNFSLVNLLKFFGKDNNPSNDPDASITRNFFHNIKRLLFSRLASRILTLVSIGLIIGGASAFFPAIIPAAAVIPIVTITGALAIGIGIAADIATSKETKSLYRENKYLQKHRVAKNIQDKIFEKNPSLKNTLKEKLYYPDRQNKKSTVDRYFGNKQLKTISTEWLISIGYKINNFLGNLIKKAAVEFSVKKNSTYSLREKRDKFRQNIDDERAKQDSPGYNNRHELKIALREQKIQTLALEKLANNQNFETMNDNEKIIHFERYKKEIDTEEKKIAQHHKIISKIKNISENLIAANNPFSKYHNPDLLTKKNTHEVKISREKTAVERISKEFKKFVGIPKTQLKNKPNCINIKKIKNKEQRSK